MKGKAQEPEAIGKVSFGLPPYWYTFVNKESLLMKRMLTSKSNSRYTCVPKVALLAGFISEEGKIQEGRQGSRYKSISSLYSSSYWLPIFFGREFVKKNIWTENQIEELNRTISNKSSWLLNLFHVLRETKATASDLKEKGETSAAEAIWELFSLEIPTRSRRSFQQNIDAFPKPYVLINDYKVV